MQIVHMKGLKSGRNINYMYDITFIALMMIEQIGFLLDNKRQHGFKAAPERLMSIILKE